MYLFQYIMRKIASSTTKIGQHTNINSLSLLCLDPVFKILIGCLAENRENGHEESTDVARSILAGLSSGCSFLITDSGLCHPQH